MIEGIVWFREDLRVQDNTALFHACEKARDGILALYIISHQAWKNHDVAPIRIDFILRNLELLQKELAKLNIPLHAIETQNDQEIPRTILKLCTQHKAQFVFFNQQYELDELRRDKLVVDTLAKNQIQTKSFADQTFFEPGKILSQKKEFITIYTPFKNACIKSWENEGFPDTLKKPKTQKATKITSSSIPEQIKGFHLISSKHWEAGEKAAEKRLHYFTEELLNKYQKSRDYPSIDGTSKLSIYLASGIISPRQCLQAARNSKKDNSTWINELLWREFYKHIMYAFPRVCMNKPFRMVTEKLHWNNDPKLFLLWQEGQTGFPIVDAGMRQLRETGWMHNRVRMIVAMFLSKLLMMDWRWGEKYFMQQLIDGDFSANNGNWQWCASTGTDAAPYFRIFNPLLQSQKFDPNGAYIRQHCPELKHLDSKTIHAPYLFPLSQKINYPKPIIDYKTAREKTLKAFKSLSQA